MERSVAEAKSGLVMANIITLDYSGKCKHYYSSANILTSSYSGTFCGQVKLIFMAE